MTSTFKKIMNEERTKGMYKIFDVWSYASEHDNIMVSKVYCENREQAKNRIIAIIETFNDMLKWKNPIFHETITLINLETGILEEYHELYNK